MADILEQLMGPPGGFILMLIAGVLLLKKYQRQGTMMIISGIVLLYVCSMPLTASWLLRHMETPSRITELDFSAPRAEAIVILGAGRREDAPEFNLPGRRGDTLSASELERIRYGVWLAKNTHLPILVTGGLPDRDGPPEAVMMKAYLEEEHGHPVRWAEEASRTTYENAKFSANMLKSSGVTKIYLVTHALHMPRSVWSFEQFGLEVIPAPTAYIADRGQGIRLQSFLPSAHSLEKMSDLFHELVGIVWYRLRY